MTKPKDSEDLRFCTVSNGDCKAPAGYGISGVGTCSGTVGTQGTCYSCGEPVCAGENCSQRMKWHNYGRRRICRNCHDPEEIKKELADKKTSAEITLEFTAAGREELWRAIQGRSPHLAALFKRYKVKKFGVWEIDEDGYLVTTKVASA